MSQFELGSFLADGDNFSDTIDPDQLLAIIQTLIASERLESLRAFFWLVLRTLHQKPSLQSKVITEWQPSESDVAGLLEDVGEDGANTVLRLSCVREDYERLWMLCDTAGAAALFSNSTPWRIAATECVNGFETPRSSN